LVAKVPIVIKIHTINKIQISVLAVILVTSLVTGCTAWTIPAKTIQFKVIPDTARLIFLSDRDTKSGYFEIYSSDEEGGNLTRISRSNKQNYLAGIDKSGRFIAVTQGSESNKQIWLFDNQTQTEIPLTRPEDHAEGRSFSPDGQWLVFWMIRAGETSSDIYKIKPDGSGLTNLTSTPDIQEFDPAWSNSGDEIAFISNEGHPARFALKIMKIDGSEARLVYDPFDAVGTSRFPAGVYDPSWRYDDKWILVEMPIRFTGKGENGNDGIWHILRISYDGKEVQNLTRWGEYSESACYSPCFSPDGSQIVFSARQGNEDAGSVSIQIVKMDIDKQHFYPITDMSYWAQSPVWLK
jgi:Tol biopolymer transport system component